MAFALQSSAFVNGGGISRKYTCDGADISPALSWEGVPAGTHSLALIVDDPDAPVGTWTHWVIWNIPAQAKGITGRSAESGSSRQWRATGHERFQAHWLRRPLPTAG